MTEPSSQGQVPSNDEPKLSDKELNFRALEAKYQREIEQERAARREAERLAEERMRSANIADDDDDDDDYIDKKKLNKKLARFGEAQSRHIQEEIKRGVQEQLAGERKQRDEDKRNDWLRQNPDFLEVMRLAPKFAEIDPDLAESILKMPDGFERQKIVYRSIKAHRLDKPQVQEPSIQDKIDANRRSPFYQPTGIGASPYAAQGDFSQSGQEQAYKKMQELKSKLRI